MTETAHPRASVFRGLAVAAAVVLPAALTLLFWRTALAGRETAAPVPSSPPASSKAPAPAGSLDGAVLYAENCAVCHGADLKGSGTVPALLRKNWPYEDHRDLLIRIVHRGRGLTMPAFEGRLSNRQIEAVADYLNARNAAP
ncbi:MAG: c-type cytochrome [Acidobacteriota bacterium]